MSARVVWITGRPASGKTTLAEALVELLGARGVRATLVDSDELRSFLTPEARYTPEERAMVYRALAYVAERLAREGVVAVVAATANEARHRAWARTRAPGLLLVYARCPAATCEARDPKNLYRRAQAAAAGTMPGVHVPYEEPTDADVVVDTSMPVSGEVLAMLADAAVAPRLEPPGEPLLID